jgi:predicted unusual protein kinase regulating ubiquinone biosynthesis (AarF/ABC1/UbiB family)
VLEAALPEEVAGPYRDQLTRLQDAAPPMPTQTVRDQLERALGRDWQQQLVWLDGGPTAAASIGQVHQGRWHDGREVAVKVQYPGAGDALKSDLRQLARLARTIAPLVPGVDLKPLIEEMQARAVDELDYELEAEAQRAFAAAFAGDPDIVVPDVVAVGGAVIVTEWLESPASLASIIRGGTQEERDHYGERLVRFLFAGPGRTGMLHADPHPGNFRVLPNDDGTPGRLGILDYGAVARLESQGLPEAMGRLIRIASDNDRDGLEQGLRDEGFIKDRTRIDPDLLLDYLSPFVEPTQVERFRFSRTWMRSQFNRINNPREPTYTVATKLNLPPSYLLIHRTWLGGIGVLSQLEAEAPFRAILTEHLPGFAAV